MSDEKKQESIQKEKSHDSPELKQSVDELALAGPEAGEDKDDLVGKTIDGKYEVVSVLGSGGLGIVYKARQVLLETYVALKILLPGKQLNPKMLLRFQREAKAAQKLRHPHIASVQDFGVHEKMPYMVMDFVDGKPLANILEEETIIMPDRSLNLLKQMCDALGYAHKHKIVHRDIKPDNMIIGTTNDGQEFLKIIDFGIAKMLDDETSDSADLTQTGEVFGTPNYMSPEQCQGKAADYRSDVYALGCVGYEMLVGEPPFKAESSLEVLMMHVSEPVPSMREVKEKPGLEIVITRALNKKPDLRYDHATEMLSELEIVEQGKRPKKPIVLFDEYRLTKVLKTTTWALLSIAVASCALVAVYQPDTIASLNLHLSSNTEDVHALIKRARLFQEKGEHRKAIHDYTKAIKLDEKSFEALIGRSHSYMESDDFKDARADAARLIKLNPENHEGYLARARADLALGNLEEAIADCKRAVKLNPDNKDNYNCEAYINLTAANVMMGKHKEAIKFATLAIELDPEIQDAYENRANAYFNTGQFDKAIGDFNKVISLDPKSASALFGRGVAYNFAGKTKKALADLNESIVLKPKEFKPYLFRAGILSQQGQFNKALKDCQKAIALGAPGCEPYISMAIAHAGLEKVDLAIKDCDRAIELHDGCPEGNQIKQQLQSM